MVEQSWCENLLNGILVELQDFCTENYPKVVKSFKKLLNNSRFRQKPVLKPSHRYFGVRSSFMEKSYFAQKCSDTLFALSVRYVCGYLLMFSTISSNEDIFGLSWKKMKVSCIAKSIIIIL